MHEKFEDDDKITEVLCTAIMLGPYYLPSHDDPVVHAHTLKVLVAMRCSMGVAHEGWGVKGSELIAARLAALHNACFEWLASSN
jgi:hypothetical protein